MAGASVIFSKRKDIKLNNEQEYRRFLNDLKEHVEEYFGGKVKGEITTSVKNNGVRVIGLMMTGEQEQIAPNFYLDRQYMDWKQGRCSLTEIAAGLCRTYQEELKKNSHLVSSITFTWEEFQKNVFLRLVNKEKNQELLKTIPYREYLDLAIVYYYAVTVSEENMGTVIVTKEHLKLLGITEEELFRTAQKNCRKFQPVRVRCMTELLREFGTKAGVEIQSAGENQPVLFVMTNKKGMFGATSILFKEELECFAQSIGKGFYVLPSSVHEVILVPEAKGICLELLASMVKEINETQVDAVEVLSDSIYFYDWKTKSIHRVA